jgi:16S rRNA (guanine527-N7)-methyltransferase
VAGDLTMTGASRFPADLMAVMQRSQERGFLGPGPVERQCEHALTFSQVLPTDARVLDLGSGGGVPGLVLATVRPDVTMTLVDSAQRRCAFLEWAVSELDLENRVGVACARAEELARTGLRGAFDTVVARSFAPPAVTAECAVGFLRGPGATVVVSEPPDGTARWSDEGLLRLGLRTGRTLKSSHASLRVLEVLEPCPDRFPRRVGIPAKRPLF